jgi:hypothetical protein
VKKRFDYLRKRQRQQLPEGESSSGGGGMMAEQEWQLFGKEPPRKRARDKVGG